MKYISGPITEIAINQSARSFTDVVYTFLCKCCRDLVNFVDFSNVIDFNQFWEFEGGFWIVQSTHS